MINSNDGDPFYKGSMAAVPDLEADRPYRAEAPKEEEAILPKSLVMKKLQDLTARCNELAIRHKEARDLSSSPYFGLKLRALVTRSAVQAKTLTAMMLRRQERQQKDPKTLIQPDFIKR